MNPRAALALIAGALIAPTSASAQRTNGAERVGIRRAARAADEAMDRGDLEGALQLYQAAFRTDPSTALRRRLADCYEAMRRPLEAVHHLERYLEEGRDTPPAEREETEARIRRLRATLATLRVRVTPRDAMDLTVTVDGLTIGPDGVTQVGAGTHVVDAAAEGFRPARQELRVEPSSTVDVSLTLGRNDIVAPVIVPLVSRPVAPPPVPSGLSTAPFFAALGGTLACAAAWTAAGVSALDARGEYDVLQRAVAVRRTPESLAARDEARARMERLALISDVAMGLSLAGATLAAVLASRTNFAAPRVELDATALQGGIAVGVRGRF